MCVRPKPVRYRCRDCHWEKTVAPRSDALAPGDFYEHCPVCGSINLQRTAIIRTEKELGEALKSEQDTIEIEGNLQKKVLKIKATGKVAWAIAISAIGLAVVIALGTGGAGAPASGLVGVGAISVLGFSTATSAVAIAVAAGGVGSLNSLRKYKVVSNSGDKLVLSRK